MGGGGSVDMIATLAFLVQFWDLLRVPSLLPFVVALFWQCYNLGFPASSSSRNVGLETGEVKGRALATGQSIPRNPDS